MKPIRSILCPTDHSSCAHEALDDAIGLAKRFEASLTLVHVCYIPVGFYAEASVLYSDELNRGAVEAAKAELEKLKADAERELGRPVVAKVRIGPPYAEIVDEAREGAYDLIVIGTHGRTGLKHFMLGSVAERVVRLAPCRVLTVRGTTQ
jgi:universal stress protein A